MIVHYGYSTMSSEPSPFLRARALLFERLSDQLDAEDSISQAGYVDIEHVKGSVIEHLEHLLNTRRRPEQKSFLTVIDYGIGDYSAYSVGDWGQMRQLVLSIEQAVSTFEPRLRDVHAELIESTSNSIEQALRIKLSAQLHAEPITDDLKVYLVISGKYGTVKVYEQEPS